MYSEVVQKVRNAFNSGKTRSYEFRRQQLLNFIRMFDEKSDALCDALYKDLHKSKQEALMTEVDLVRNDIVNIANCLSDWMAPEKVKKPLPFMMDNLFIKSEPFGVVLILGAWNYPIQLCFLPLAGALAAGNTVIVKPSEISSASGQLIVELLPQYLDKDCYKVITGGASETKELLKEKFDYIMYTGNSAVGKIVMTAASKYLTPCTLELGGKNPVYVDDTCNMEITAKRIAWGKFMNNGQTCLAPDYILCESKVQERLAEAIKKCVIQFYGENIKESVDYGRIINLRHLQRIEKLLSSGSVYWGGEVDKDQLFISPTILFDVKEDSPIMEEEIFGPVIPFVNVKSMDDAISFINAREKALALYVFSKDKNVANEFLHRTSSGSFCANDTIIQAAVETMPFGGVGNSGFGFYHGKFTFDTFSHKRACLVKSQGLDQFLRSRYPPYSESKIKMNRFFLQKSLKRRFGIFCIMPIFLIGIIIASFVKYSGLERWNMFKK